MEVEGDEFKEFGKLTNKFLNLVLGLTKMLKQDDMKYLSFQLDFNEFYQNFGLLRIRI